MRLLWVASPGNERATSAACCGNAAEGNMVNMKNSPEDYAAAFARHRRKEVTLRDLAVELDVNIGTLSRKFARFRRDAEAEKKVKERVYHERWTQTRRARRGAIAEDYLELIADSEDEARQPERGREPEPEPPPPPVELDTTEPGMRLAFHRPSTGGAFLVLRDWPEPGHHAVACDLLYLQNLRYVGTTARALWLIEELYATGWLLTEADPHAPDGRRRRRWARLPDGTRERLFCIQGIDEPAHLQRMARALLDYARRPSEYRHLDPEYAYLPGRERDELPPQDDSTGRIPFIATC